MEATAFESDQLLKVLTEALRRGPGSPEWHDAIERLKHDGVQGADEYRLLLTVRERLESGQEYREVRAGPGFTRELFGKLENEQAGASTRRPVTAIVVGLICVLVLVGSAAVMIRYLSDGEKPDASGQKLAQQLFSTPIEQWTFENSIPASLVPSGTLKFDPYGGLRAGRSKDEKYPADATLVSKQPMELSKGVCVESQMQFRPGTDLRPALVVSGQGEEISLTLDDAGFLIRRGEKTVTINRSIPPGQYTLRLKLNETSVIAEVDGRAIWSDSHALTGALTPGVRISRLGKTGGDIRVQTLRILGP